MSQSEAYSGVVIGQNTAPAATNDHLATNITYFQTFKLPSNYARGVDTIPPLTGFQFFVGVTDTDLVDVDWTLDHYETGVGWSTVYSGNSTLAPVVGTEVWLTLYFAAPYDVNPAWLSDDFRASFTVNGGVDQLWYTAPNPYTDGRLMTDDTTPVDDGGDVSALFRVLAGVADSGTDYLGNSYRSALMRNTITSANTGPSGNRDSFYLSAPQPSKFAVVSQYFDIRDEAGDPTVVTDMLLDPTTPGMYAHLYYTNDDTGPGTDAATWENLLWTPVTKAFQAITRQTWALPQPISAKYLKVEYSHLQAKPYAPGNFQKPIVYKKHPKWVLDYFLARVLARNTEDPFIARRVEVTYDALDFAFNYYRDDLIDGPEQPPVQQILTSLRSEDSTVSLDPETLSRIRVAFQPYLNQPGLLGRSDYMLGNYLNNTTTSNYSVESIDRSRLLIDSVSSLDRDAVILEKDYPVMFFFVQSRHAYRVAEAKFDNDRAYFAGVAEIAFLRERYDATFDSDLYIENAGDLVNVQRSDFEQVDFEWVVYGDH